MLGDGSDTFRRLGRGVGRGVWLMLWAHPAALTVVAGIASTVGLLGKHRQVLLGGVGRIKLTRVNMIPRRCCSNPAWCNGFVWFTGVPDHLYPPARLSSGSVSP